MKIRTLPLSGVSPYPGNPRLSDRAVDAVAESISRFGFRQPIVVDGQGVIVCGHARYAAAVKLGLDKVPVHIADDLSEADVRAYRIADNKTAELAAWDEDKLREELGALRGAGYDWALLGFGEEDLATLLYEDPRPGEVDPDSIPSPPAKAKTRPGDLIILGDHRLLCGDSASAEDVDRLLDGDQVDLVNTDPPYNVDVNPRTGNPLVTFKPSSAPVRAKERCLQNDKMSDEDYARVLLAWFGNMARALRPGRSFYIWGGYSNVANYPVALAGSGLRMAQAIIWVKRHPFLTRKDFLADHEWCFYGWREGAAHRFFGPKNITDCWQVRRVAADSGAVEISEGVRVVAADGAVIGVGPPGDSERIREVRLDADRPEAVVCTNSAATDVWSVRKVPSQKMVHLTEKPVELAARALRYSTKKGERVLDLFGGSGSTLIACEQLSRRALLMEIDPAYCDVIVERWETFTGRKAERPARVGRPRKKKSPAGGSESGRQGSRKLRRAQADD